MNPPEGFLLVVDDNEMNRDLLSRQLRRQGHKVAMAENGRAALEQMKDNQFDLVLLDIMMPEMNGYEVLAYLQSNSSLRHIPVIVISAADDMDSIVKCIELGAEDYLPKPYNALLLQARIGACLAKKRLYDKEKAHLAELAVMQRIDQELNATLNVRRAMEITLDWAMSQSGEEAGLMGTIENDLIQVIVSQGYNYELSFDPNVVMPDELPAVKAMLESGRMECVAYTGGSGLLARTQSQIAVPLRRGSDISAVLLLESASNRTWDDKVLAFLNRLSNHAAMAIANAQLYEAMQAANLAKTEFVSFVSHELKIPMTSIRGYADLLLSGNFGPINEAQTSFLHTIRNNVNRMAHLVSDLADVSRIEAGHLHLETRALPFSDVVEEVVQSTRAEIEAKRQTLTLDMAPELPPVWGDRTRLVQILTNLLSNAYKYTPENGHITIQAEAIQDHGNNHEAQPMVHVTVTDTGLGIKEEDQAAIFSKFFRASDEEALQSPGTGLGLNITKNLVEMHDGRIWFESKYREGTTFHFVIPAAT